MTTKIRFYTDEQVARAVVEGLRRRGVEVFTCQEANLLGAPDRDHLFFRLAISALPSHKMMILCVSTPPDFHIAALSMPINKHQ